MKLFALISCLCIIMINEGFTQPMQQTDDFKVQTEQFADVAILRYRIEGFDKLSLKQKELLYYLYEAALSGRDMIYDQNFKYNLTIRRTLEAIIRDYKGDRTTAEFGKFIEYTKRVWFSNGIHHHYSSMKFLPEFSQSFFSGLVKAVPQEKLPLEKGQTLEQFVSLLTPLIFDPAIEKMKTNQADGVDVVATSANNFYEGLTQKEVENYYNSKLDKNDPHLISIGLNSKLIKKDGRIEEQVWKLGGMYSAAIERVVYWLEKAAAISETEQQRKAFQKLIEYYKSGDLRTFDEYCIEWVKDTQASVDAVNGFIETYEDPLSYKATYESVVSFKDFEATKRIEAISNEAQWFEDNSPIRTEHKKKSVKGISAKVITVVVEAGASSPATPIGINLPNANWIRKEHGSKSVNLGNIVHAYNLASSDAVLEEFCYTAEEVTLTKKYGSLSDDLHTDMHEVIGHASGQINAGVGSPRESLKNYASTIEEARADLVALYYIVDPKLVEIGVMPSLDAGKAEYNKYIRNGLMTQLQRIKPGENIEEAHMRNRQLIAAWAFEHGRKENVIERKTKDGKTFFVINDYQKLRVIFGELLREMQRITSEGDYAAARNLVENYGVKVDKALHAEVLQRYEKLHIAPYRGFINPVLVPKFTDGKLTDVQIEYPDDFMKQMMYYAEHYSFLPSLN